MTRSPTRPTPAEVPARAALLIAAFVCLAPHAAAQTLPDKPRDYVVDLAGVIDRGAFIRINDLLHSLEQSTRWQVIVLTVQSTADRSIEEFALAAAEKWKLGRRGEDSGVLLLIAVRDRKYRFEVGYGAEAILTDGFCGELGRQYLVPAFRKNRYGEGVELALLAMQERIRTSLGVSTPAETENRSGSNAAGKPRRTTGGRQPAAADAGSLVCAAVFIALLIASAIWSVARRTRRRYGYGGANSALAWMVLADALHAATRSRRSGGWSSGGFGSGGFGGSFGGGGGGRFGGGGASGSW